MKRRLAVAWLLVVFPVVGVLVFLAGCGEKIAAPVAKGQVGNYSFSIFAEYEWESPIVDMIVSQGRVYVLQADSLHKYTSTLDEELVTSVTGMTDARAMAVDEETNLLFVWDEADQSVSWYGGSDLDLQGETQLPAVQSAVAIETNSVGISQLPGAVTFLYLSDPDSLVIHRYSFDHFNGLMPYGILARADGDAARFVHIPAAIRSDIDNMLLVCDQDTNRNWVIRFNGTPDLTDISNNPAFEDELRGAAVTFFDSGCPVESASDFVLGNAPGCQVTGWEGKPSSASGEFHVPAGLAIDGQGRIFAADYFNNRVQLFSPEGSYELRIGGDDETPHPTAVGVYDIVHGSGADEVYFAAYVYVLLPELNRVVRYVSKEYEGLGNEEIPPPLDD